MKDMTEKKLNLNIPITDEEVEFEQTMKKYMGVYKDMSSVFIRHNLTIDEGIEFLEIMWMASHEFKNKGLEMVEDTVDFEED